MAAAYAFHIAENQAFVDGNKRAGLAAATAFLAMNGYDLIERDDRLYTAMIGISARTLDKRGWPMCSRSAHCQFKGSQRDGLLAKWVAKVGGDRRGCGYSALSSCPRARQRFSKQIGRVFLQMGTMRISRQVPRSSSFLSSAGLKSARIDVHFPTR
jgi:Fic/DOC family protein